MCTHKFDSVQGNQSLLYSRHQSPEITLYRILQITGYYIKSHIRSDINVDLWCSLATSENID